MAAPLRDDVWDAVRLALATGKAETAMVVIDAQSGHVSYVIDGECLHEDIVAYRYIDGLNVSARAAGRA